MKVAVSPGTHTVLFINAEESLKKSVSITIAAGETKCGCFGASFSPSPKVMLVIDTALLVFLSFHLHLLCDIIGARGPDGDQWPIPYLEPFSSLPRLIWSGQWALNAWPNMLITAVLIALAVRWAWQRGYSPLEMVSARADAVFVETLRRRFPAGEGK